MILIPSCFPNWSGYSRLYLAEIVHALLLECEATREQRHSCRCISMGLDRSEMCNRSERIAESNLPPFYPYRANRESVHSIPLNQEWSQDNQSHHSVEQIGRRNFPLHVWCLELSPLFLLVWNWHQWRKAQQRLASDGWICYVYKHFVVYISIITWLVQAHSLDAFHSLYLLLQARQ